MTVLLSPAVSGSALDDHVMNVISSGAQEAVVRANTAGIVTVAENAHPIRDISLASPLAIRL